jgi:hypothetical protein
VLQELAQTGSMELAQETAHNEGLDDWFNKNVKGNKELRTNLVNAKIATHGFWGDDDEGFKNQLDYYRNTLNGEKADNQPMSDGEVVPVFSRPANANANVNNTHNNQYHFNIVIDGGASEAGAQELYDKFKELTGDTGGSSDTFDSDNIMAP